VTITVVGDELGLPVPADLAQLHAGGAAFLTTAFRACGTLNEDNAVTRITELVECGGGSTGRKALLGVEYASPDPQLPTAMFVKFSRDLDDSARDNGRFQMEYEVRLALLSRAQTFPIAVPACRYGDFHRESGTGILITERIPFGRNGIEPQYEKCLDYLIADQLSHYRAVITALARLAGTAKSGRLPDVEKQFPVDLTNLSVGERVPYSPAQLQRRVARFAELTESHPELLPPNIRTPAFLAQMTDQVTAIAECEDAIWRHLEANTDFVALCHWNANIDNAWFWRADGLECGLLDWGCVGQMNVAMAIWGALCSAETAMWDDHLDELLGLFADEFRACGGPELEHAAFRTQVLLYAAIMGVAWLLDVPAYLQNQLPPHVPGRTDARIADSETIRSRLRMMTNFLNLWETADFGQVLDRFVNG
jgi:hypothetical protein